MEILPQTAVGTATLVIHCRPALEQWEDGLLLFPAALPRGSGQWIPCCLLPDYLGAAGSGSPAGHYLTAWGHWAAELVRWTAAVPGAMGLEVM